MNRRGDRDKPEARVCRGDALERGEASWRRGIDRGDRDTVAPVYGGAGEAGDGRSGSGGGGALRVQENEKEARKGIEKESRATPVRA